MSVGKGRVEVMPSSGDRRIDRSEDLASGTFYLTLMQVSYYALAFMFYIIVARVLSPSEVGSFSLLLMAMVVFNTLTLLALNNAVIKFVSEGLGRGDIEYSHSASTTALKVVLYVSLPALFAGFVLSPIISSYINVRVSDVVYILSSAFILNLTSWFGAVMLGYSLFRQVSLQNILFQFLSRVLGLLLAYIGLRVTGLSLGFLIGSSATLLYSLVVLRERLRFSRGSFPIRRLFDFSLPIYGHNIIGLLQGWLDVAILSGVAGLSAAGTYFIAVSSVTPLTILWVPLSSALFPTLSFLEGSGDKEASKIVRDKSLKVATAIILPLSAALSSVSYTALSLVYGSRYAEASIPFSILGAISILSAYSSIYSAELQSKGFTRPILIAGLLSVVAYLLLLAILAAPFRQVGAALARAAMVIVSFATLYRKASIPLPANLWKSLLSAIIVGGVLIPLEFFLNVGLYLKAFVELVVFIASFGLTFMFMKPVNKDDVELLKTAIPMKIRRNIF
jgi:O-antigen/teichoic acid export membrane protein